MGNFTFKLSSLTRERKRYGVKKLDDTAGQIVPCKWGGQRVCLMSNCIRTDAYQRRTY